jgi:hypothetical protein
VVILGAQVEVAQQDGAFNHSNAEDCEDHEQEPKDVVELVTPDRVQNEEELDEDATKRQDTAHENPRPELGVERLWRNLPRDLVCADWLLDRRSLESEVCSEERLI